MKAWQKGAILGGIWGLVSAIYILISGLAALGHAPVTDPFPIFIMKIVLLPGYIGILIYKGIISLIEASLINKEIPLILRLFLIVLSIFIPVITGATVVSGLVRVIEKLRAA